MEYVLYHHGIKGQKWGVRRYQNQDGSLTEAGKKRIASNREATIAKGTILYRISSNSKSDISSDKMYLSTTKESADFYVDAIGGGKLYRSGKIFVHEYISKTDLKLPDRKTMEKIELTMFDDKQAREEVITSLMKKGGTREKATRDAAVYSAGKAFMEKMSGIGTALAIPSYERRRVLDIARMSYGDKKNVAINDKLVKELSKKGYNAVKDYNDRQMFGDNGKQSIIVFDGERNLKPSKISEITANDYGKAYARSYLNDHPNSKLEFNELVKTGEAKYKERYESGVANRNKVE